MLRTRVVRYATYEAESGQKVPVIASIKYDGENLTINSVEGPMANGNCVGKKGPVRPSQRHINLPDFYVEFTEVAQRWNLNGMREGTFKQEQHIRDMGCHKGTFVQKESLLDCAGLLKDGAHRYGSKWIFEEVPESIINFLFNLPEYAEGLPAAWARRL